MEFFLANLKDFNKYCFRGWLMGPLCGLDLRGGSDCPAPKWKWNTKAITGRQLLNNNKHDHNKKLSYRRETARQLCMSTYKAG